MGLRNKDLGNYIVYSDGRVFSKRAGLFMVCPPDKNGYHIAKVPHRIKLHRLVAISFKENKMNYPQVNHKDGNKSNNKIQNLEWCTAKHNVQHAFDIGLIKNVKRGAEHMWAKLTDVQVHVVKEAFDNGYKGFRIARYFKIHRATAYKIRDNVTWQKRS